MCEITVFDRIVMDESLDTEEVPLIYLIFPPLYECL